MAAIGLNKNAGASGAGGSGAGGSGASGWRKPLAFACYAALGCLLAAVLGEIWLAATKPAAPPPPPPRPAAPPQAIVLVLDNSYSMEGQAMADMKQAAIAYINRQDLTRSRLAVVRFDSAAYLAAPLTHDANVLRAAVNSLQPDGMTRMDLGLDMAAQALMGASEERNILLFTDGLPTGAGFFSDGEGPTLQSANQIRQNRIRLLAIASGDADRDFLQQVTGDPNLVFWASDGKFGEAFEQAERVITPSASHQLVDSAPAENLGFGMALLRIGVWTGLLGLGIAAALLLAQSLYMQQSLALRDFIAICGGLLVGGLAGIVGQFAFEVASHAPALLALGRLSAWAMLGCALGWGMSLFIPNLRADRGALGGTLGGLIGALGFLFAAAILGDVAGRFLGAAVLGFCIGLMVVLAEVAFRKAWLQVQYGNNEPFHVNLGEIPITVGNNRAQSRIRTSELTPVAVRYSLENKRVYFDDELAGQRTQVGAGDQRRFGDLTITVAGEVDAATAPDTLASGVQPVPAILPGAVKSVTQAPTVAPPTVAPPTVAPPTVSPVPAPTAVKNWILSGAQSPIMLAPTGVPFTLGRGVQNRIVLGDPSVSTQHAVLTATPTSLTITDSGSTNGTFVNGRRLNPQEICVLAAGDTVRLGRQEYTVRHS